MTILGGKLGAYLANDLVLIMAAPLDELCNRDHGQAVLICEAAQLWRPCHVRGVILRNDLTQHTGWAQARQSGKVNGSLRMAITL